MMYEEDVSENVQKVQNQFLLSLHVQIVGSFFFSFGVLIIQIMDNIE